MVRRPVEGARRRRRHRHGRQDDDLVPRRRGARGRRARAPGSSAPSRPGSATVRVRHEAHVTTPGAPELQATLRAMVANGNAAAVVETTSHALELERVAGIAYDAAVFTNLTHEHLDLHGTFERYRAAKLRLFAALGAGPGQPARRRVAGRPWPKLAVINRDDPAASWFEAAAREAGATVLTYGTDPAADVRATSRRGGRQPAAGRVRGAVRRAARSTCGSPAGSTSTTRWRWSRWARAWASTRRRSARASRRSRASPGGMERIEAGQPFGVIVDYAHSPASLRGGPGAARADRRRARRRADRRVRVRRRAGRRQAARRWAGSRGALPARGRDGRGSEGRGPAGDRRRDRAGRGGRRQAPGRRRAGDPGPRAGHRRGLRAGPAGRRRPARRQGPRAHDPVRGPRDPVGRGRRRPPDPGRHGLRRGAG